ncbi:hypothetical protein QC761_0070480 [Podospora bellae-mahoneyi]|uniref:Mitochondrial division protein 1 n=1 Tax=Podospora bellae-mahoneyi TaxID=2093777 RepID=A0ABR0FIA1_9PEZI|nr:hypothetical protein QC761_0070480 [Podospora bellae-mahoneyi]
MATIAQQGHNSGYVQQTVNNWNGGSSPEEKDKKCLRNLLLTDPRLDKEAIEDAKGGLLEQSYCWIFGNTEFKQWQRDKNSWLLWIKGDPGKGKTMLLCGIIDKLKKETDQEPEEWNKKMREETSAAGPPLLSFFFCQASNPKTNNATAVLRGLIYLLVKEQPSLLRHVRESYDDTGKQLFEGDNAWFAVRRIFTKIRDDTTLKRTYFIIDALDECETGLKQLLKLLAESSLVSSRIKWIVSSRNWLQIEQELEAVEQKVTLSLELNTESVAAALNAYIGHKVLILSQRKKCDKETETRVQDYLSTNASGTFLWVALVCQALESPEVQTWHIQETLEMFPPGLDSLYARIMKRIRESRDADLCRKILAVAATVCRPISLDEITSLVKISVNISNDPESLKKIVKLCGSFLTVREKTVYFVHESAKDYLLGKASGTDSNETSQDAFNWVFPLGEGDVHRIIFSQSLEAMSMPTVLRRDMYDLKTPGFPIDKVQTPFPDPLAKVRYSCAYWVDHLCNWQSSDDGKHPDIFQDGGIVDDFLRQHYLHWLEALSLCKSMPQGILSMAKFENMLQVYASALVFSPAQSITRGLFTHEKRKWITSGPIVEDSWNACRQTLEGHGGSVRSVAFSPDSKWLASGSGDNTIKIWEVATGSCTQTLEGHGDWVWSVAFSPDSKWLASGSAGDNTIKIWEVATGLCTQTLEGYSGWVTSVAFSPDSKWLALGSEDNIIKIWEAATGSCTQTLEGHRDSVWSVAFSPDSKWLASGLADNIIKIWEVATGSCTQTLEGHGDLVRSVAFSPDSKWLASGSGDNTIKIWEVATGSYTQTLEGHGGSVWSVAFSPDSKWLTSGSGDNTIKIWEVATGSCTQTLEGHRGSVWSVAFSPDSKWLASGSGDNTIKIWEVAMGLYTQTLEGHGGWVWSVAFSPDSKWLASGSGDNTIKIWEVATGSYTQTLEGHRDWVWSVAFSPDSKWLAAGSGDNTIKIWEVATGSCTQTLEGHGGSVWSVAFSPDSKWLASGSAGDNTIKIWEVATGSCTQTLEGHGGSVWSVAFSPDSKWLASGSAGDNTIKIWEVATGSCTQTLEGHGGSVRSVAFSPDSKWLASGSDDANSPHYQSYRIGYGIGFDNRWITRGSENWLWLPLEYRPSCLAVTASTVAIGCSSGRVLTITFTKDS